MRANTPLDFARQMAPGENGCVLWTGAKNRKGYGQFSWAKTVGRGRLWIAHRWIWTYLRGPIPDGAHILHSCDTPACVNIAHLRVGTNDENVADKMARKRHRVFRQTHCKNGHEFTEENTRRRKDGAKACRACDRANCAKAWRSGKWTKPPPAACSHGHAMTPENTAISKNGRWNCRACNRVKAARYSERRRL